MATARQRPGLRCRFLPRPQRSSCRPVSRSRRGSGIALWATCGPDHSRVDSQPVLSSTRGRDSIAYLLRVTFASCSPTLLRQRGPQIVARIARMTSSPNAVSGLPHPRGDGLGIRRGCGAEGSSCQIWNEGVAGSGIGGFRGVRRWRTGKSRYKFRAADCAEGLLRCAEVAARCELRTGSCAAVSRRCE